MRCYLCSGTNIEPFIRKNGYQLFHCRGCGLFFYDFKNDYGHFLKKQYSKGYFTGEESLRSYFDYGKDEVNITRNHKSYLNDILRYKKSGRILDIGCAYGFFLKLAKKAGFDVYGIDASEYAISVAKKRFGKHVARNFLSETHFPQDRFDVITLFDVFEHLNDPKKDLAILIKILKDDGLLVIATGDTNSFWARLNKRKWTFYNPPQHIFYFNDENIRRILDECGFKVLEIKKTGKWLSLRYIVHLAKTVGENKLANFIYPFIASSFLGSIPIYLKVNDNMVLFIQKKKAA